MTPRPMPILLALSALLILPAAAQAQGGPAGFLAPSKNIACAYFDYDRQNVLCCDIMEATVTARRPADCDLEWGKAFEMRSKGNVIRLCYGDTVMEPRLPILAYGAVWQRGGFTCTAEPAGVTCFNADRRGFALSRAKQEIF